MNVRINLENQIVIVTGGSRGIGRAIAVLFAEQGARVVIASREGETAQTVTDYICSRGGQAAAVPTDVTIEEQVDRLVAATLERFGRIDGLVNSAGNGMIAPLTDTSLAMWQRCLDVNLTGTFLCCRAVWGPMLKQGKGRILNVSSGAAKFPHAGWSGYCAAKAGVIAFSEALGLEGFPYGIRVDVLCPGATATDMRMRNFPEDDVSLLLKPEEVAQAALFFFSDIAAQVFHAQLDVRKRPRGV